MPRSDGRLRRRRPAWTVLFPVVVGLFGFVGLARGHSGSLRAAAPGTLDVPTWLFLLTGGGAVGASFLLASFVTDRAYVRTLHEWARPLPTPGRVLTTAAKLGAVVALGVVLVVGFTGPVTAIRNLAILVVWVGWWGGYVASAYLLKNTWPVVNPFRTIADALPTLGASYPERLGAWPSVVGLLALVWVEVVTPLADDPRLLATVVAVYGAITVAGAAAVGSDRWFASVDPVSRLFAYYGRVAPVERTDDGFRLRLPATRLRDADLVTGRDEVAFVVAVLFVTTYDGFVGTGLWADFVTAAVDAGLPPTVVYLGAYLGGFAAFLGTFWAAARLGRRFGETYLTTTALARRFAPSLLAIAAGYHLAHNLGFVLTLLPSLVAVLAAPLAPPQQPPVLAGLPGWFSTLELAFVLAGHVLAVWVAHGTAYAIFPGRLQAVRSQYGTTLVMVAYTMLSLWIVSEPTVQPPFL